MCLTFVKSNENATLGKKNTIAVCEKTSIIMLKVGITDLLLFNGFT